MTMSRDLFLAILSMDSYNRGYGVGVRTLDASGSIGQATILTDALGELERPDVTGADFYAIAYSWHGETVIAYRGSDYTDTDDWISGDIWQGWSNGAGFPFGGQPGLAIRFYEAVTGALCVKRMCSG